MDEEQSGGIAALVSNEDTRKELLTAARFSAIAGFAFALLFLTAFWLLSYVPRAGSSQEEIESYYNSNRSWIVTFVALYLIPFAGIAFIWFVVSLRMWISRLSTRRLNQLLTNVQLVSGIIYIALFFASAAAISVNAVVKDLQSESLDPTMAMEFPQYGNSLFFVFAIRMGAMFVFTSTGLMRQTGNMPKWLVYGGYAVGLVMLLSASFNRALIVAFPLWTLVVCVLIWRHAKRIEREAPRMGGASAEPLETAAREHQAQTP